jgi:hypothetical protein
MENEDIKNSEVSKTAASKPKKAGVSISYDEIPLSVHKYLKSYRRRINADRGKNYTIKQAYREYTIENAKRDMKTLKMS